MQSVKQYIFYIVIIIGFYACVPANKLRDEQARVQALEKEKTICEEQLRAQVAENKRMKIHMDSLRKVNENLVRDTLQCKKQYRKMVKANEALNQLYEELIKKNKDLVAIASAERERLSLELEEREEELEKRKAELLEKEQALLEKEQQIAALRVDLESREKRLQELERLLAAKDSALVKMKNDVSKALLGFSKDDLSVEMREGKIYVSLAEKLLFQSGSTVVDPKGVEALTKLAAVLKDDENFDILIEGHTDNVPIHTTCIKDNWDLSVLRATAVVRILLKDGVIDPQRIIPSGRGEYLPVASNDTPEGRRKNRRTEVILSPRLDKIFEILNSY